MPSTLIDIPPDDVFRNDKLGLKPAIQERSRRLLANNPQAIAIDAAWGTGKTTFIRLWAAYLREDGVKVVEFNAWKFSLSDPLDALTREILCQFDDIPEEEREPSHRGLINLIRRSFPLIRQGVKLAATLRPELANAAETLEPAAEALEFATESIGTAQFSTEDAEAATPKIDSPDAFTSALSEAAKNWSKQPVVIMVDELDRCSPEYAVEMLQLLEHVFYAENVVFVVSMNRAELAQSVKGFYGEGFDANGYLERFFDDVLGLPASNRVQYIRSHLETVIEKCPSIEINRALPFLISSDLSLREIDRAIRQLEDVLESNDISDGAAALVHLWVARTLAPVEYRQFVSDSISDKALVEAVFLNGDCDELRKGTNRTNTSYVPVFEAIIIDAYCNRELFSIVNSNPSERSELYIFHMEKIESIKEPGTAHSSYSEKVVSIASDQSRLLEYADNGRGIAKALRLLDRDAPPRKDSLKDQTEIKGKTSRLWRGEGGRP